MFLPLVSYERRDWNAVRRPEHQEDGEDQQGTSHEEGDPWADAVEKQGGYGSAQRACRGRGHREHHRHTAEQRVGDHGLT